MSLKKVFGEKCLIVEEKKCKEEKEKCEKDKEWKE